MEELGTPSKLMDERMGHADGSVQARYSHVTAGMRDKVLDGLTDVWETALAQRRKLSPGSPVAVLDRLLLQDSRGAGRSSPRFLPAMHARRTSEGGRRRHGG